MSIDVFLNFSRNRGLLLSLGYPILSAVDLEGIRLLQLRDPWKSTWSGKWQDSSALWTPAVEKKLLERLELAHRPTLEEGVLWLSFDEFLGVFDTLSVCPLDSAGKRRDGFPEKKRDDIFVLPEEKREVIPSSVESSIVEKAEGDSSGSSTSSSSEEACSPDSKSAEEEISENSVVSLSSEKGEDTESEEDVVEAKDLSSSSAKNSSSSSSSSAESSTSYEWA